MDTKTLDQLEEHRLRVKLSSMGAAQVILLHLWSVFEPQGWHLLSDHCPSHILSAGEVIF